MSADLLAVLATVGAATLGAAAGWAVVRLVGWLLARRRRSRLEDWEVRCHRCAWGFKLTREVSAELMAQVLMTMHYQNTGHLVEARMVVR